MRDGSSVPPTHALAIQQATWPGCTGTQLSGWVCVWDGNWYPASHATAVQQAGNPNDGPLVDRVEIWTCPTSCTGSNATFRGVATYGLARPDIATLSGATRWTNSGFSYTFSALASGTYQVQVRMRNALYATSWNTTSITITVPASNPLMTLEAPTTSGASVAQPFSVNGWAIDTGAPTGTGVNQVDLWAARDPGSGAPATFWGAATLGGSRPAVGQQYGAAFTNSGFTLAVTGQPTGPYALMPYAHSSVTGAWQVLVSPLYVDIPTMTVTIDRQGTGTGGITASGLSCAGGASTQGVPCGASYAQGTVVTLSASADAGATFAGWGGACSGTGTCQLTMTTGWFVTATFTTTSTTTAVAQYYHTDAIGSVRAVTDDSGATVIRHDYAPFGEDTQPLTGDPMRFAGKELDPESALEYFGARYYRNVYGRFYTPDPVGGTLTNPQRWNGYAYALNNPLRFVDPTGQSALDGNPCENAGSDCYDGEEYYCWVNGGCYAHFQMSDMQLEAITATPDCGCGDIFLEGVQASLAPSAYSGGEVAFGFSTDMQDDSLASLSGASDVQLLARVVFAEAGGESTDAMTVVAWSVQNRVGSSRYPDSYSAVIFQKNQYDATTNPRNMLWAASANPSTLTGTNAAAWDRAFAVAMGVSSGMVPDPTGGATLYHSGPPSPWFQRSIDAGTIKATSASPIGPFSLYKEAR